MITNSAQVDQVDLCISRKFPSPFNSSSCDLALLAEVTNKGLTMVVGECAITKGAAGGEVRS